MAYHMNCRWSDSQGIEERNKGKAMSAETLRVLYVGKAMDGETFKACAEGQNWYVYLAETHLQALGIFIHCYPEVIVLNATTDPAFMDEIYEHFRTVDSTPIVILSEESIEVDEATRVVSPDIPFSTLTVVIQELVMIFPSIS